MFSARNRPILRVFHAFPRGVRRPRRLIAQVGESQYGRLAVNTSLFVKVSCVCKVGRMNFTPPPEVDSMVVKAGEAQKGPGSGWWSPERASIHMVNGYKMI